MRDLNDLYYFVRVVDNGGFAAAARATNVQKSKLSRRIFQLEDRLGVRLINRSTRQFSVTDIGQDYYDRCVAMLAEAEAADQVVAEVRVAPKGLIRVSCPIALLQLGLGDAFARFLVQYPDVEVVLESTNRHVDVINEGYDLAIRARFPPLEASDLIVRKLEDVELWLVASPSMRAQHSVECPADLARMPSIALGPYEGSHCWQLESTSGQTAKVVFSPRFVSDDLTSLREAAIAGIGVARLPPRLLKRQISDGTLVRILPEWDHQPVIMHAVFPSRRGVIPSVRSLLDFLAADAVARGIVTDPSDAPVPRFAAQI